MKTCGRCKKHKCNREFNADKKTKDGLQAWCRICHNKKNAENREGGRYRESWRKGTAKWQANNKKQVAMHKFMRSAITKGSIVRQPCVRCGDPNSEGHHDDYDKPLDITWLCAKHHKEYHRLHPATGKNASGDFDSKVWQQLLIT